MRAENVRQRIANLTPEQRALLEQRLQTRNAAHRNDSLITPRDFIEPVPLSFAQERLWFLEQLEPGQPVYHIPFGQRLTGALDKVALEASVQELVRRHDALRTTFTVERGQPFQVVHLEMVIPLDVVDLTIQPNPDSELELGRTITEQIRQPFDLTQGPLLRTTLFALGADDHLLLLTMHHIISDGWSIRVLSRELSRLYSAITANQPPLPADGRLQYADYAVWQRSTLAGDTHTADLTYWTAQLNGAPPFLELPTDYPRPAVKTYAGDRHPITLSASICARLAALGRREGVTPFMAFLAAFQILLYRYSGQSDLVIGTPIAGRTRPEIEELIGFFVNTLPLRTDLSGQLSVRDLLARVRQTALDAYDHQELPFEQLVEALHPPRNLSYTPVVQVLFNFYNMPITTLELPGIVVRPVAVNTGVSKFDLSLTLRGENDTFEGWLEYSSDLFRADTIARMAQHFTMLLEAIVANPDQPITDLPLLTATEQHTMLVEWNATCIPLPDQSLPDLFAAQVQRTPDAIALVDGDEQLSYRQLDQRANQLARYLQQLGVGPEIPVALCLERSVDLLIGVLAILKAGGVYVPLDPSHPAARLALLLADIAAPILLAHLSLRDRLPAGEQKRIWLETTWPEIATYPTTPPEHQTTPNNLAYVIYTSGSTGTPKGVMVEHRSVVRLVINTDYLQLSPTDVVTHASNPAFDALTFELWGAWLNGARLVLLPQDVLLTPPALADWLEQHQVTTLFLTTSLFHQIAREQPVTLQPLRHLLIGGEACDPHVVNAFIASGYTTRLLNSYGPTETTTFATSYAVSANDAGAVTIPIGRPIANTTAYVLDPHLQPVPIGVPGELYVGGVGVARGYLNQPELSAARFLPDPYSSDPTGRLYRTGDLVRYRPDGKLEFLGRIDQQVKLRGYRIELGEIEAVLSQHPAVHSAVVLLREDRPGDRRLVAYVVPRPAAEFTLGALRAYLSERLPDYMLPAAIIPIERFPLTPNGKLDRQALPIPGRSEMVDDPESVAPRNASERDLVQIWEELLGVRPIGVRDNFFDLGGHSLLAVRLFAEIRRAFDIELPLAVLFPEATVERLAHAIQEHDQTTVHSSLVSIQPNGSRPPFFCVHSIDGDVLRFATLARFLGDDQPFYGLRAQGLEGTLSPLTDIKEIATTYVAEIRRIQPVGPYFLGGYSGGGTIAFEMASQLQRSNADVALVAVIDHVPVGSQREKPWVEALAPDNSLPYLKGNAAYCLKMLRTSREQRDAWLQSLVRTVGDWVKLTNRRRMQADESQADNLPWRVRWLVAHLPDGHRRVANEHFQALNAYVPERFPGRITLLKTSPHRPALRMREPEQRWAELARDGVDVKNLTGRHEEIFDEPHVHVLGQHLRACLEHAQTSSRRR